MDILGVAYEIFPSHIDEKAIRDPDPFVLTKKLAEAKARKIAGSFPNAIVISGDAVVARDGRLYEKPGDLDEALAFLRDFSGTSFHFITSLAIIRTGDGKMLSTVEASEIHFRQLLEREIRDYVGRYPVLHCAGAFEGDGVLRFAEHVSGSCNVVTGMPLSTLALFLRELGVEV